MSTELQTEISALRATARAALANPFIPRPASDAIGQACKVIDLMAAELQDLRRQLASHFHARMPTDFAPLGAN